MFLCPQCCIRLQTRRGRQGLFWECPSCGGRAATVALLRKTVPRELVNRLWQEALHDDRPAKRECPACAQPMAEVTVSGIHQLQRIDVCGRCQFVWFDGGEYEDLPEVPPPIVVQDKLPQAVREQLALLKVEQLAEQARAVDAEDASPDEWWHYLPGIFGLPVEAEDGGVTHLPLVTWVLTAIITAVSGVALFQLDATVARYGLIPNEWSRLGGLTLMTSFLLHGGLFHLLSNLYFLVVFGDNVEDFLGHGRFLVLIVLAALTGDVLHIVLGGAPQLPSIGASGGISGVIAFYACQFPHARLGIMLRFVWLRVSAIWLFAVWVVLQIAGASLQEAGHGGVGYWAHLGGAAVGFGFWLRYRRA